MAELPAEADRMLDLVGVDPKVFARNLARLTEMHNLTRKQVAERIGAKHQWYRRIVTKGLTRIQQDHQVYLKKLARLFRINRVEDLWKDDLIVFRLKQSGLSAKAGPQEEEAWYQDEYVPIARKLFRLLATGKHEFLKDLIDKLHATLPPEEASQDDDS